MKFDVLTIFPEIFNSYLNETFIKKAQEKDLISINIHNLRDWSLDKHKKVDDSPFGGGLGMVMQVEPIYRAINDLRKKNTKIVVFSPRGETYTQKKATELSKYDLLMVCGRYEGVDERVVDNLADEVISIGEFDLMGGELPAMILIESISRLIPNVLGKESFLKERMTENGGFIEYPQYTRPEVFKAKNGEEWSVPEILLSGNHKEIEEWREKSKKVIEK